MGSFVLTACNTQPSYIIKGSVPQDFPDHTTIIIKNLKGDTLNTTQIENHTYTFTGHAEGTQECTVYSKTDDKHLIGGLFLENGKIQLNLEKFKMGVASGTPINDAATTYFEKKKAFKPEETELLKKSRDQSLTKEERLKYWNQFEEVQKKISQLIAETIDQNIQNPFGLSLIDGHSDRYSVEQQQKWIDQVPEQYKDERVEKVQKRIDDIHKSDVGTKYYEIEGKTPAGKPVKLSEFVGKSDYLLVDFWAHWCFPCRHEMAIIKKIHQKHQKDGLQALSISLDTDDSTDNWLGTVKKLGLTWPQMRMDMLTRGHKQYGVRGIPFIVVLDKEGKIVISHLNGEELEEKVDELFK